MLRRIFRVVSPVIFPVAWATQARMTGTTVVRYGLPYRRSWIVVDCNLASFLPHYSRGKMEQKSHLHRVSQWCKS